MARREDALRTVQTEVSARYGVEVTVVAMDLGQPDAPQALYERVHQLGKTVDVLVNNAGFGYYGEFAQQPWEREQAMLQLDILTLVHLTKLFLADMLARDAGYILQVASVGAYQPSPTYASYCAAKSYVLNFGEALNYELRHSGVSCTVLSPGVTATEFFKVSGQQPTLYQRAVMMPSAAVARIGIEAMLARRPGVIAGWLNNLMVWSNRLAPRRVSTAIAHWLMTQS